MTQTAIRYARVLRALGVSAEAVHETASLMESTPALSGVLEDPTVHAEQKRRVASRIFPAEIAVFMQKLCDENQAAHFPEIAEVFDMLKAADERIIRAELTCVTPPDAAQTEGMKDFVKNYFGAEHVELTIRRDESLIGGFILNADGVEWDYSTRRRIARLREALSRR